MREANREKVLEALKGRVHGGGLTDRMIAVSVGIPLPSVRVARAELVRQKKVVPNIGMGGGQVMHRDLDTWRLARTWVLA